MKFSTSLTYNLAADLVEGFTDDGYKRTNKIADHVLVWMLKGIYGTKPWKQPVVFSFCKGTTPWENIALMFKEIVIRAHNAGLTIVALICDKGSTNVKAIRHLIQNSKREAFYNNIDLKQDIIIINEERIIPLYDPPHLLKCIRNNLLTKDLQYKLKDDKIRTAKWSHVEDVYEIDNSNGHFREMRKLTDFHVVPSKIKKMKVSYCTQVLSNTVSSIMALMSKSHSHSFIFNKTMLPEGVDTAELLFFFNELFDSLNGSV